MDSVNGFLTAKLFPDLSTSFNLNWSQSEQVQTGDESENYGWSLNCRANLTPKLNTNVSYSSSFSKSDNDEGESGKTTSTAYRLGTNYRASDILAMNLGLSHNVEAKTTDLNASASWRVTPKIQTSFGLTRNLQEGDREGYSASLNWSPASHLSLRTSGDYQVADGRDNWSWRVNASASF